MSYLRQSVKCLGKGYQLSIRTISEEMVAMVGGVPEQRGAHQTMHPVLVLAPLYVRSLWKCIHGRYHHHSISNDAAPTPGYCDMKHWEEGTSGPILGSFLKATLAFPE